MGLKLCDLGESFGALITHVLLAIMFINHVFVEPSFRCESFMANGAYIFLFFYFYVFFFFTNWFLMIIQYILFWDFFGLTFIKMYVVKSIQNYVTVIFDRTTYLAFR